MSEVVTTLRWAIPVIAWGVTCVAVSRVHRARESRVRRPSSFLGVALHYFAIFLPFVFSAPIGAGHVRVEVGLLVVVAALCGVGLGVFLAALRALGAEWSLVARVTDHHHLATGGPYRFVRHPVYLAALLLVIASGLAVGHPIAIVVSLTAYALGTAIRVHAEEALLRNSLGDAYDLWAGVVPALFPRRQSRRRSSAARVSRRSDASSTSAA